MKSLQYRHTKYAAYLGYITQAIGNNLAPLLFTAFQREFNLSLDQISFLIAANFGIQIMVDLSAAHFIDRIGYRKSALIAHITASIGLLLLGILPFHMQPFGGMVISVMLCAVGGGLNEVVISPIVEAIPGDEKESDMSLLHSFYCWGQVAVVLFSTLFFQMAGIQNWRYLPMLWALIPASNILLFSFVPIRSLSENGESLPLVKLFRIKIFWMFLIMMLCAGASELGMSQWSSYFAENFLHVSKTVGDLLGPCAFAILMGISRTFYGFFGTKINLNQMIFLSGILCVFSYLLAALASNAILSLIGCALCGLSVGIMWPGTYSLAASSCFGGTAMFAILALAGDVGCSIGPSLVGTVSDWTSNMKIGLLSAAIFPLVLLIGASVIKHMHSK